MLMTDWLAEFADELDNLGVRVAKLEKNADNVKITGNVRLSYKQNNGGKFDGDVDKSQSDSVPVCSSRAK